MKTLSVKKNNMKTKPKPGMGLHTYVALGGKPSEYNKANSTEKLRASSKAGSKKK